MTGSNKTVTVSYGTFTCTLEGFDMPFNTMHAIVEYFRDLAAESRQSAAGDPGPEPDALLAIARLEEHLVVEARPTATGICLTQIGHREDTAVGDSTAGGDSTADDLRPEEDGDGPDLFSGDAVSVLYGRPASAPDGDTAGDTAPDPAEIEIEVEDDDGTPRTLRMTRSEFDAALAAGEIEEITESEDPTPDAGSAAEAEPDGDIVALLAKSPLDEARRTALALELTRLEREAGPDGGPRPVAAGRGRRQRRRASPLGGSGDATLDRLIDETDVQFRQPDANRRRTSIAHLKRAVAATVADDGLRDRWTGTGRRLSEFRQDLDRAVRPGNDGDGDGGDGGARPQAGRDAGRTAPAIPVAPASPPSRGPAAEESDGGQTEQPVATAPGADGTGERRDSHRVPSPEFAAFARDRGAEDLPDLIVAAAAYAALAEGSSDASRPELIGRAASVHAGDVSREDGLAGFAKALRTGRISRLPTGRFALARPASAD
ncbi:hypothetical protein [Palleronia rufa]|uniref:hypothetical protein n=1 Tax=Palleronia rufa TaxID=1530186 RepID=UPI00056668B8|nr:hypothetical protein [Palleronia rufa]